MATKSMIHKVKTGNVRGRTEVEVGYLLRTPVLYILEALVYFAGRWDQ